MKHLSKKQFESFYCLIPVEARRRLERVARGNWETMSWVLRALLREYRRRYPQAPKIRRPRRLRGKHVRFCLKLHGDKQEMLMYCLAAGTEFSSLIRQVLEMWMDGELAYQSNFVKSVKKVKKLVFSGRGIASAILVSKIKYENTEFWPKNPTGNRWLMELGLSRRVYPLVI